MVLFGVFEMETQNIIPKKKETQHLKRFVEVGQEGVIDNITESVHIIQKGNEFFSIWVELKGVYMHITEDDITIYKVKGEINIANKGKAGRYLIPNKIKHF